MVYYSRGLDVANLIFLRSGFLSLTRLWKNDGINSEKVMDMTLLDALDGQEYIIKQINTDDEELNAFLFSLGCYVGEPVTVVSHLKGGCVVSIKDGRYNIDNQLASAVEI